MSCVCWRTHTDVLCLLTDTHGRPVCTEQTAHGTSHTTLGNSWPLATRASWDMTNRLAQPPSLWCDSNRPSNRPASRLAVWLWPAKSRDVSLGLNQHNPSCIIRKKRKGRIETRRGEAVRSNGPTRAAVRSQGPSVRSDGAIAHHVRSEPCQVSPCSSPALGLPYLIRGCFTNDQIAGNLTTTQSALLWPETLSFFLSLSLRFFWVFYSGIGWLKSTERTPYL